MYYGMLFLLVIVALCYFETMFANMKNKYIGLILPIVTFFATVVMLFIMADEFDIVKTICTLLFTNIPTYILLLIYSSKRKKMNIK